MINENTIKDDEAYQYVREALRDLMLFFPLCGLSYLGEAVEIREDARIPTLCTDGRRVWYSPKWIKGITHDARIFDLLHEWLHIFFNHVHRRGDRDPDLWNTAIDAVVVSEACSILSRHGRVWTPPSDGVIPEPWMKGLTAEEIYDGFKKHPAPPYKLHDQHNYDSAEDLLDDDNFRHVFVQEMAKAALVQSQVQGAPANILYGDLIGSRLGQLSNPTVPWGALLRGTTINELGDDDISYSPPSARFVDVIMPRPVSVREDKLVILVDVSASVGETLFGAFKSNIVPAASRAEETVIITFDAVVREIVRTKNPGKVLDEIKFSTGYHSGTSSVEAFEELRRHNPRAAVCMTDGYIQYPETPWPGMIWVIPQNGHRPPWGRIFTMEVSW
jgi:hypothetical protein